jgi:hypothetical protein
LTEYPRLGHQQEIEHPPAGPVTYIWEGMPMPKTAAVDAPGEHVLLPDDTDSKHRKQFNDGHQAGTQAAPALLTRWHAAMGRPIGLPLDRRCKGYDMP